MAIKRYRGLVIKDASPPVGPETVRELEGALGASLPAGYRALLGVAAAGRLDYGLFVPDKSSGRWLVFSDLYSAIGRGIETLIYEVGALERAKFRNRLPSRVLPIARTGGEDDTLCLDLTDEGYGRVVAFVSGRRGWEGRAAEDAVHCLAKSFEDYADGLDLQADDCEGEWQMAFASNNAERLEECEAWLDTKLSSWRETFKRPPTRRR